MLTLSALIELLDEKGLTGKKDILERVKRLQGQTQLRKKLHWLGDNAAVVNLLKRFQSSSHCTRSENGRLRFPGRSAGSLKEGSPLMKYPHVIAVAVSLGP